MPVLSSLNGLTYTENASPTLLDTNVTFADDEQDFDGGTVVVSGLLAEDIVSINNAGTGVGEIGFDGTNITYEGIIIGTAAGGEGASLTITLNASADNAGVEALIEALTYENTSDVPTVLHGLSINVTDAGDNDSRVDQFVSYTGVHNPFDGLDVGARSSISLADVDNDGDLDAFIGDNVGSIRYYENTGDVDNAEFIRRTGEDNPLDSVLVQYGSDAAFVDIDNDGDLDVFVGQGLGKLEFFENTGNADAPEFTEQTGSDNPLDAISSTFALRATFLDMDGDGDQDVLVGYRHGTVRYFENTGNADSPEFAERTGGDNPLSSINFGSESYVNPFAVDYDDDGDMDLVVGHDNGQLIYYENTGNEDSPVFTRRTGVDNPFDGIDVGDQSSPEIVDIDNDGDLDFFSGNWDGRIVHSNYNVFPVISVYTIAVDDPASFGGDLTGSLNEDTDTLGGSATVTDPESANQFTAETVGGTYGELTIAANGDWVYDLDEANTDVQALGAGDTLGDTLTIEAADGTEQDITITINGANDAATFGGNLTGALNEDTDSVSGSATVTDPESANQFTAETVGGTYGDLTIAANGDWVYDLDEANTDVQALGAGDTLGDTLTVESADGTEQSIVITVSGVNDAASFGGTLTGSLNEDTDSISGSATVTDPESANQFTAETVGGTFGDLTIAANGDWVYDLDEANTDVQALDAGDTVDDTLTVEAADGTEQSIVITVSGVNDAATFGGDLTGSLNEDTDSVGGSATVTDPESANQFTAETVGGTYGDLTIAANGDWVYDLDVANVNVQSLGAGDTLGDTVTVQSADGTEQDIVLTIGGADDAPTAPNLSSAEVTENKVGAFVGTLSSDDAEGGVTSYRVDDDRFHIEGNQLWLKDGVSLDYESEQEVRIRVTALDEEGFASSTLMRIKVLDVDDEGYGSAGNDMLVGTSSADMLVGNGGKDTLRGGEGDDTLLAGGWKDDGDGIFEVGEQSGGTDDSFLWSGAGNDVVMGAAGADVIGGNAGDDLIHAGDGKDTLFGAMGDDTLSGDAGDDLIYNGAGADSVDGGAGDDTLWAGAGDDILSGGAGADVFRFGATSGNDTISDFDVDEDALDLSAWQFADLSALSAAASDATVAGETGLLITLDGGQSIFLVGLDVAHLADMTVTL
ncbi:VCBS domain-containing protein [Kordiimonas sp.]|uniref:VCBS domain-containing protein n=1 Tax=Kordiimonas sp. TaxID=1970157 RepID=UPI003A8F5A6B